MLLFAKFGNLLPALLPEAEFRSWIPQCPLTGAVLMKWTFLDPLIHGVEPLGHRPWSPLNLLQLFFKSSESRVERGHQHTRGQSAQPPAPHQPPRPRPGAYCVPWTPQRAGDGQGRGAQSLGPQRAPDTSGKFQHKPMGPHQKPLASCVLEFNFFSDFRQYGASAFCYSIHITYNKYRQCIT